MGRYSFAAQRVHAHATHLLERNRLQIPPPWYQSIGQIPPSARLIRPPLQRARKPGKKSSKLFKPLPLSYAEDQLRWEYFNDHPWELAKPRVVLEGDGRDYERWDWSVELDVSLHRPAQGESKDEYGRDVETWERVRASQSGRPLNGEAVVQRQNHLINHSRLSPSAAYDCARKELYRVRHAEEIETRVAHEEALSTGAVFGLGPLDVGMMLEDKQYESWREWAEREAAAMKQLQGSAYTGTEGEVTEPAMVQEVQEVVEEVPASKAGLEAKGGAAVHP